jgi:drug/metabolite transporter (DMT)-like permease
MQVFILIARIFSSPLVNLYQKRITRAGFSPGFVVLVSYSFFTLLSVPLFIVLRPFHFPAEFWISILVLGTVDLLGNWFLVRSLALIDLSVFGPLNAYKPVFALAAGIFVVGERPGMTGIAGVLVILSGSYLLSLPGLLNKGRIPGIPVISRGAFYRLFAIFLTSMAAVYSKKAILLSSPLITLMYWSVIGLPFAWAIWRSERKPNDRWSHALHHVRDIAALLVFFLILQISTLMVFKGMLVGYALALFQLSALVSVFFGYRFFGERHVVPRLLAAGVMVAGALILILSA